MSNGKAPPEWFPREIAEKYRIVFYDMPDAINMDGVDPLMRPVITRINQSGVVWTAECCQGHPDYDGSQGGWYHNTDPFIRLVTAKGNFGHVMGLLASAMRLPDITDGPLEKMRLNVVCELRAYMWPHDLGPYEQVNVYVGAKNVQQRDRGIEALMNFANSLHTHKRERMF